MMMAETIARRVRSGTVDRKRNSSISSMLSGGAGLVIGSGTSMVCAVNVSADVVGGVMEAGLRAQVEFTGAPAQVSATAELKPFVGFTVIVTGVLTAPWTTVTVVGAAPSVKSVPVPVRLTVCGLPQALSVMVKFPVRAPAAVGVNVTLIVQVFDPAVAGKVAGLIGHAVAPVLVSAKSPDAAMELIVSAAFTVFVSV